MKKFLAKEKILAAAIATLAASAVHANLPESTNIESQLNNLNRATVNFSKPNSVGEFVLTPSTQNLDAPSNLYAAHASHYSHGSHASHSSHYSSRY